MVRPSSRHAIFATVLALVGAAIAVPQGDVGFPVATPAARGPQLPLPLVLRRRGVLATRGRRWNRSTDTAVSALATEQAGAGDLQSIVDGAGEDATIGSFAGADGDGVVSGSGAPFVVMAQGTSSSFSQPVATGSSAASSLSSVFMSRSLSTPAASSASLSMAAIESLPAISSPSAASSPSASPTASLTSSSTAPSAALVSAAAASAAAASASAAANAPFSLAGAFHQGSKYYPFAVTGAVILSIGGACALIAMLRWCAQRRMNDTSASPVLWVPRSHSQALLTPPFPSRTVSSETLSGRPKWWIRFGRDEEETSAAANAASAPVPWDARSAAGWADARPLTVPPAVSSGDPVSASSWGNRCSFPRTVSMRSSSASLRMSHGSITSTCSLPLPASTLSPAPRPPIDVRARLGLGKRDPNLLHPEAATSEFGEMRERDTYTRRVTGA